MSTELDFLDQVALGETAESAGIKPTGGEGETPEQKAAREAAEAQRQQTQQQQQQQQPPASEDSNEEGDEEEPPTIIGKVQNMLGVEVEGEFEDTEEGIVGFVRQAAPVLAEQYVNQIFEQAPVVKDLYQFMLNGGDPRVFMETMYPQVSYSEMQLGDNEDQHEAILRTFYARNGVDNESIEATIQGFKAAGLTKAQAEVALKALAKAEETDRTTLAQRQAQAAEEERQEAIRYWKKVEDTIKKANDFKGVTIPEVEKQAFYEYISKPVKDGKTQETLDMETEESAGDISGSLLAAYMRFKKFSIDGFVKRQATTQNVRTITDRLKGGSSERGSSRQAASNGSVEGLDTVTQKLFGS